MKTQIKYILYIRKSTDDSTHQVLSLAAQTTSVTNALGQVTRYQYDEAGDEIAQIDALLRTNIYAYDGQARRLGHTIPGGQSEGFAYDLDGNQIFHTNFDGTIVSNSYDADNRLTNVSSAFGYNVIFAYSATGQRTHMIDASGTNVYEYDNRDRLILKTIHWNTGPSVALNYLYDANGNLINLWSSTSGGVTNVYEYDPLSRLTNVIGQAGSLAQYAYDLAGNLQALQYANGVTNRYQYDSLNRLTNLVWGTSSSPLASFAYRLGVTGSRTNLSETVNGTSRNYQWQYDNLYRLTNEAVSITAPGSLFYQYDSVGNRLARQSSISQLPTASYSYTTNDWLSTDKYDLNGNTTNSGTVVYQYDVMNHLTNANGIVMTYDGDGNRVAKTISGATIYYLLDDQNPSGYSQVLEEYRGTTLTNVYNYGLSLISQLTPTISTNYFISDGHGSTRMLTDIAGTVVNVMVYDSYGNLIASNGLLQTAYLYSGQQYDSDLGLYLNRARYLNTGTGRFWTMDGDYGNDEDPLSLHKYLYAGDDPVDGTDPTGNADDGGVGYGSFDVMLGTILTPIAKQTSTESGTGVLTPLEPWPTSQNIQLLTAAIFSESSSTHWGGVEDPVEKIGIGAVLYNDCFYAKLPPGSKQTRNYNAPYFGDGTVIGALRTAFKLSYLKDRWNLIATATNLKPQSTLNTVLQSSDRTHYNLSLDAAYKITFPSYMPQFNYRAPVTFNKASDAPPSKRQEKIGSAGKTTFYGFKPGREYQ